MARALKVFRTPIGFHDAYVAVPTKKAALAAWGSSANLFARGVAEEVTDPKLTEAPLATPGEVVKVPRGTAAEHVAALGKMAAPKRGARGHPTPNSSPEKAGSKQKLKPKPSREKVDAAEAAVADLQQAQHVALTELAAREKALAEERRKLEQAHASERRRLEEKRDAAEAAYQRALDKWRG